MSNRGRISAEIEREIFFECGHRCAVCGEPFPLERAHIIPWRKSKINTAENLICLCANCHVRADKENWSKKVLWEYKKSPWVMRKYKNKNEMTKSANKIEVTIDMELESFDEKNQRWLQYAIAAFLGISPYDIKIISIEKSNSVKVTLEVPKEFAVKLMNAIEKSDLELKKYLCPLVLVDKRPEDINGRKETEHSIKVLLVNDELEVLWPLINFLEREGYKVKIAERAEEALKMLPKFSPQIVFLDVKMPGMSGLEALKRIRKNYEDIITFILTGNESIKYAVQAIKTGAYDYFSKSYHIEEIKFSILKALKEKRLEEEVVMLRKEIRELGAHYDFDSIITADPKMFDIFDRLRKVAPSNLSILITGENGTGKELLARAIHYNSNRKNGPFTPIDCAAIPDNLFESEMFGYEKGAFTGAERRKKGLFEMANKGTLFLNEVGNLKPDLQNKLLKAVQERKILPFGGKEYKDIDLRIISSTSIDLEAAENEGTFREDLYFRINQFHIHLPPLRDRANDIILLARYFLNEVAKANGKESQVQDISPETEDILINYPWPGNIRQLKIVIQGASILAKERIFPEHLPYQLLSKHKSEKGIMASFYIPEGRSLKLMKKEVLAKAEKIYIERVLMESSYQKELTSSRLNINQGTLSKKMEEYNIKSEIGPDDFNKGWIGEFIRPGMTLKELNKKIDLDIERSLIIKTLYETSGNKAKTARKLEIDYKTLLTKINELQITKKDIKKIALPPYIIDLTAKDPSCSYKQLISQIREKTEGILILMSLRRTSWDKAKTAIALDIDSKSLKNKLRQYGLMDKRNYIIKS